MTVPERPQPQYGEYASKEEQVSALERSGVKPLEASLALPPAAVPPATAVPGSRPFRSSNLLDSVATIFLLSFGLVYVIGGAETYLNLGTMLHSMLTQLDMGDYHPTEQTAPIGVAILVVQSVIWVITAVWAYRRMSHAKHAWWVAVTGGVLAFLISSVLLGVLLAADPAFMAAITKT